jgi:hypothetical protein
MAPILPQRHPIYIHEDAEGTQVYGFPAIDGGASNRTGSGGLAARTETQSGFFAAISFSVS